MVLRKTPVKVIKTPNSTHRLVIKLASLEPTVFITFTLHRLIAISAGQFSSPVKFLLWHPNRL
jgi:hypothetical protein